MTDREIIGTALQEPPRKDKTEENVHVLPQVLQRSSADSPPQRI